MYRKKKRGMIIKNRVCQRSGRKGVLERKRGLKCEKGCKKSVKRRGERHDGKERYIKVKGLSHSSFIPSFTAHSTGYTHSYTFHTTHAFPS